MSRYNQYVDQSTSGLSKQSHVPIPPIHVPSAPEPTASQSSLPSLTQLIPWDDDGFGHPTSAPLSPVYGFSGPNTPPDQKTRSQSSSYASHSPPARPRVSYSQSSLPPLPGKLQVPEPRRGPVIPQRRYQPLTASDRRRYVEEVELQPAIHFHSQDGEGFPLKDALNHRYGHLLARDEQMFVQHGPSISLRLNWPGYQPWTRQIPTRDFRNPPGPITRDKLTKNVAKSVQRFIEEQKLREIEHTEARWRVGEGYIELEDLVLLRLDNVSKGSWQIQLQLITPLELKPRHPQSLVSRATLNHAGPSSPPRQLSWKHVSPASTLSYEASTA